MTVSRVVVRTSGTIALAVCLMACRVAPAGPNGVTPRDAGAPRIEITTVPAYGTADPVAGRVLDATPSSFEVAPVIYVGSNWWTKPTFAQPTVPVASDGTWSASIVSGGDDIHATRIAVFLLPADAIPPLIAGRSTIPNSLYDMAAASAVAYRGPHDRIVEFSGYPWRVKRSDSPAGPGPNWFSDSTADVSLTSDGLTLHISQHPDARWYCSEVILERNLGFGTYIFRTVGRLDILDPQMVAGFFTWDSSAPPYYREMDFEFTRWGDAGDPTNYQFVVQPWDTPGNLVRRRVDLTDTASSLTLALEWRPGSALYKVFHGHVLPADARPDQVAAEWLYSGAGVPVPDDENVRINFWLTNGNTPTSGQGSEFLVRDFVYQPLLPTGAVSDWVLYD